MSIRKSSEARREGLTVLDDDVTDGEHEEEQRGPIPRSFRRAAVHVGAVVGAERCSPSTRPDCD